MGRNKNWFGTGDKQVQNKFLNNFQTGLRTFVSIGTVSVGYDQFVVIYRRSY